MRRSPSPGWLPLIVVLGFPALAWSQPPQAELFQRFDRNRDGKLSREEAPPFLRERFDRIDTNRDGALSREEDTRFRLRLGTAAPGAPAAGNRPAGMPRIPENVVVEKDIAYAGTSNPSQTLDLYRPKSPREGKRLPVIVNIHGGAFRAGDKSMGVGGLLPLVGSGDYAAASINYRLSGEARWPAQIHDCKAAIRWVRANADKYGFDPERIGVIGGSAGGHLVAMLGTSGGAAELEGDLGPHRSVSSKVRCVVDEFGPSELLTMGGMHDDANSPESLLIGGPIQEHKDQARAASPISHVSKGDPPFLIFHGTNDPLVPFSQSERLARALKDAGVDCLFVPIEGGGHGGFRSPEVPRRTRQFFDRHLRGLDVGPISETPIAQEAARGGR